MQNRQGVAVSKKTSQET
jgi:hypothetical protein